MRRLCICVFGLALGAMAVLDAQDAPANPLSTEARGAWTRTINNAVAAAEKMPEDAYTFKPTPESMSFRDLVAHTADSAMGACSAFNGERKTAGAAQMTSKADLVGAMKAAQAECEKAYSLDDAKAVEMMTGGRGGPRSRLGTLWGNTVHIEHEYAQMAVQLRLKGLVPPSSEGRGGMGRGGR
ncbi:MAG TPA: DinB family protein [Bryobacteraceae bacterium]|nr:DinB family protein [Bryobacteraceae bacterium]